MSRTLRRLWNDERGFVVSAELALVATVAVMAIVVGLTSVASSVNRELNDVSNAFGALDQTFFTNGLAKWPHAAVVGSGFVDRGDVCDCQVIFQTPALMKHSVIVPPAPYIAPAPVAPCPLSPCPVSPCPVSPCPPAQPGVIEPVPCPCSAAEKPPADDVPERPAEPVEPDAVPQTN
ncbi:MAG: Flp family type IVb pilin [Planctomycetaceae bacterium]